MSNLFGFMFRYKSGFLWYLFLIRLGFALGIMPRMDIYFDAETWDASASCTREEYKSNDPPDYCDYQNVVCSYTRFDGIENVERKSCKVRRKGFGTWRSLDDKPSLKIKDFNDDTKYTFATYNCNSTRNPCNYIPNVGAELEGREVNEWKSKKVTLQNMVYLQYTEGTSYDVFREMGFIAPMTEYITVQLWKNDEKVVPEYLYMMLETINDKEFVKKHAGQAAMLFEVERFPKSETPIQFKRGVGVYDDELVEEYAKENLTTFLYDNPPSFRIDTEAFVRYHAVEGATLGFDSLCTNGNNAYLFVTDQSPESPSAILNMENKSVHIIASGADLSFCWFFPGQPTTYEYKIEVPNGGTEKYCPAVWDYVQEPSGLKHFKSLIEEVKESKAMKGAPVCRNSDDKANDNTTIGLIIGVSVAGLVLLVGVFFCFQSTHKPPQMYTVRVDEFFSVNNLIF